MYLFAMHLSASKALKVHTTELTDDVVQHLRFRKPAFTDDPRKHGLDFVCDKFIPSLAMEVALHKASLNSFVTGILATVVGVAILVLEMSFHLAFRVERMKTVIIAALEGFEWGQWYCHDEGWRCWKLNAPVIGTNAGQSQTNGEGRVLERGGRLWKEESKERG